MYLESWRTWRKEGEGSSSEHERKRERGAERIGCFLHLHRCSRSFTHCNHRRDTAEPWRT